MGLALEHRKHRRWFLVGYWLCALLYALVLADGMRRLLQSPLVSMNIVQVALYAIPAWFLVLVLGGSTPWKGAVRDLESNELDEYEIRLRNAAHYEAYKYIRYLALFTLIFCLGLSVILGQLYQRPVSGQIELQDGQINIWNGQHVTGWGPEWLWHGQEWVVLVPCGFLLCLLVWNLPETLILWWERDMEEGR
jgi:hypothetical protein